MQTTRSKSLSALARRALPLALLSLPAAGQQSWSDAFDRPGLPGRVFALGEYQGEYYVGGLGGVERGDRTSWVSFGAHLVGRILAMHVHDGVLYIGGSMFGTNHLVSYDGATQLVLGGGTNAAVNALESFGGDLLVGGVLTTAGGVPANRLARWNGSAFSAFGGTRGTHVDELAVYGGEPCASGNLIRPGLPDHESVARWDGAGCATACAAPDRG